MMSPPPIGKTMPDTRYIPDELKRLRQWVGVKNDSKFPLYVVKNLIKYASSSNPDTWMTFEEITQSIVKNKFDNYGFVFHDNGIVGIDIDKGFNEDGFLSALAIDIMNACKSYTEYSRSGRGMHILVSGKLPFGGRNNRNGVEIYENGRYFIVTGKKLIFTEIIENQQAIDYIVGKYFTDITVISNGKKQTANIYQPTMSVTFDGGIKIQKDYPDIEQGCRNICLTSLAGQLRNQGYTKEALTAELIEVNNAKCKPPLDKRELNTIINSVMRYRRN